MQEQFMRLDGRKNDVIHDLQRQERNAVEVVRIWMGKVERIREAVEHNSSDYNQHKRCLFGCCPDCCLLLRLSGNIRQCIADIDEHLNQGKFEFLNGQLGEVPPPPATEMVPVAELVGRAPQSAQSQIEGWLTDHETRIIGVYGMGGVGKTPLVKNINNSSNLKALFDVVILTAVSQNPDIKKVQDAIAERLGLSLPADNMGGRRAKLYNCLQKKKYLLILDDLWDMIDLVEQLAVGVPSSGDGSKIVLTTRDRIVCDRMDTDQLYELRTLSTDESWELFRKKAFRVDHVIPQAIEVVARDIAAECNGLPLALNCIAAAMRSHGDDLRQWSSALQRIKNVDDTFYSITHGHINAELFQRLRLSYDSLPEDLKPCFLDCAMYQTRQQMYSFTYDYSLFPIDVLTDVDNELIPMWIAEGLLAGGGAAEDLTDKGHDFIKALRNRCLIEAIDDWQTGRCRWIKVHDILQDLAIKIGKEQNAALFRAGDNVVNFPLEKECVGCRRISVMHTNLQSLPMNFKCDTLLTLVLHDRHLEQIPESFLTNLPLLKVLDLSLTSIRCLPSSLGLLKELVHLNLSDTNIEELPQSIGNLTSLQFLDLTGSTELASLPSGISELRSLKALHLGFCEMLNVLRPEISQLTSLEKLIMSKSDIVIGEGSAEMEMEMEMNEICLQDLRNLGRLRQLSLRLKSPIGKGLLGSWKNMRNLRLDFTMANQEDLPEDMRAMHQLETFVLHGCNVRRLPDWICTFQNLSVIRLIDCNQLRDGSELRRMPSLKTLHIVRCNGFRNLWMEGGRDGGFPVLDILMLEELPSLECLVGGVLEDGVMPNLKRLLVNDCEKLKALPLGMEKLQRLEEIGGSKKWWDGLFWECDHVRDRFQKMYVKWVGWVSEDEDVEDNENEESEDDEDMEGQCE